MSCSKEQTSPVKDMWPLLPRSIWWKGRWWLATTRVMQAIMRDSCETPQPPPYRPLLVTSHVPPCVASCEPPRPPPYRPPLETSCAPSCETPRPPPYMPPLEASRRQPRRQPHETSRRQPHETSRRQSRRHPRGQPRGQPHVPQYMPPLEITLLPPNVARAYIKVAERMLKRIKKQDPKGTISEQFNHENAIIIIARDGNGNVRKQKVFRF